jgi:PKD repeat protein
MDTYPDYNHTACHIECTPQKAGICSFQLTSVQVTDTSFTDLEVNVFNTSVKILETEGNGGSQGNGGSNGNGGGSPNMTPVANISVSETTGFAGTKILFNGSSSYDEDGTIESYTWNFDDGETAEGMTVEHIFFEADNYSVTLTVTDNDGASGTSNVNVQIIKGNNPPVTPRVTGQTSGHMNTIYEYLVNATDVDNDTLCFYVDWGDSKIITDYYPIDTSVTLNHSWKNADRYFVTFQAYDGETYSRAVTLTVFIDASPVEGLGFFLDVDGDSTLDLFQCDSTGERTITEQNETGWYLIDCDNDGKWDYAYDAASGDLVSLASDETKDEQIKTPALSFLPLILVIIGYVFFLRKRK